MIKIKFLFTIFVFSFLLTITSIIKNQTRIIEKNIYKIDRKILVLKKDLSETELDYFYLSSPNNLSNRTKDLALIDYVPMDFSRIYLNYNDFLDSKKTITNLKNDNEKKK
jgi:hypothetical protein